MKISVDMILRKYNEDKNKRNARTILSSLKRKIENLRKCEGRKRGRRWN